MYLFFWISGCLKKSIPITFAFNFAVSVFFNSRRFPSQSKLQGGIIGHGQAGHGLGGGPGDGAAGSGDYWFVRTVNQG
jgi:hypothetical protein